MVTDIHELDWYLGWVRGRLVFEDRSLTEIIAKLEQWYVLDIQLEDKDLGDRRLTAEIDYRQPMTEVLNGIALSLGMEVHRHDRMVTFSLKR